MKPNFLYCFCISTFLSYSLAHKVRYDGYKVLRLTPETEEHLNLLDKLKRVKGVSRKGTANFTLRLPDRRNPAGVRFAKIPISLLAELLEGSDIRNWDRNRRHDPSASRWWWLIEGSWGIRDPKSRIHLWSPNVSHFLTGELPTVNYDHDFRLIEEGGGNGTIDKTTRLNWQQYAGLETVSFSTRSSSLIRSIQPRPLPPKSLKHKDGNTCNLI